MHLRGAITLLVSLAGLGLAAAQDREPKPVPLDLIRAAPFDRITLTDGMTVDVEPVSPRPLPPYDPKAERRVEAQAKAKVVVPREGNILLPGQEPVVDASKAAPDESATVITVKPIGQDGLFRLKRANIKSIDYYEDLLLQNAQRLAASKQFSRAFDHVMAVRRRNPAWPGLEDRVNALWLTEGVASLDQGDTPRALRLLLELHASKKDAPGLADALARAFTGRIETAFARGDYADARAALGELEDLAGPDGRVATLREPFLKRAGELMARADKAGDDPAAKLDAVVESLRVWPTYEKAVRAYPAAFAAMPTLDVAVADLPLSLGPWGDDPASNRVRPLLHLPLLADTSDEAAGRDASRDDQLLARVEVADLGRSLRLQLAESRSWSGDLGPVTAFDVGRSLIDRTRPDASAFRARWSSLVDRIEVVDSGHVLVMLRRPAIQPRDWLSHAIAPSSSRPDGLVSRVGPRLAASPAASGPFVPGRRDEGSLDLLARASGPEGSIRRVREVAFASPDAAVAALLRGDVSYLERVPASRVVELEQTAGIKLVRAASPRVHVLALDGRNPKLRNRTLRRGLSTAIDRAAMLAKVLRPRAPGEGDTVADGVFVRASYADAPAVPPLPYDSLLARMLVAAGRKEMGGEPLRFELAYPARDDARSAVPELIKALVDAGVEITPRERPEAELERDLRGGLPFDIAYRVLGPLDPIHDATLLVCPGADAPASLDPLGSVAAPRILQLLLQLETATSFPAARGLAIQVDRELRDELPVIPLWQIVEFAAHRDRLRGPVSPLPGPYHGIDSWRIDSMIK
jgi:peptide/nickel transport system substrate-binding protein